MSEPRSPGPVLRALHRVQWRTIAMLAAIWVVLWGDLSVANVISGVLLGVLITVVFPLPPIEFKGRLHPLAFARLVAALLRDLVRASLTVAVRAFRVAPTRNAILRADLRSRSDLYLTLTSEFVSLVPGSLVVEVRRREGIVYLHAMDVRDAADRDAARAEVLAAEARVLRAFGSPAEIAALRAETDDLRPGGVS